MWTLVNCKAVELTEWKGKFVEAQVVMETADFEVLASEIENGVYDNGESAQFAEIAETVWQEYKLLCDFAFPDYITVNIERFEDPDDEWNGGEPWLEVTGVGDWVDEVPVLNEDMIGIQSLLGEVDY